MSGSGFVHLNDPGTLSQLGKNGYGGEAENAGSFTKKHLGSVDNLSAHMRGQAGNTSMLTSAAVLQTDGHLAKHLADEALRAVFAEKEAVTGDDEAQQGQQGALSTNEGNLQSTVPPINV